MSRGHTAATLPFDELAAVMVWANPFLPSPPFAPEPVPLVRPWVSPGRVSLAPEVSAWDRLTWGAAVFAARNPGQPVYRLTVRDRLFCYLAAQSGAFWSLPDDPLDSTEWIRQQRLRPFVDYAGRINDPALRLRVCR